MKVCQKCNSNFKIAPEDREFYGKIDVPEPTLCPPCRMQKRMTFRNERNLFKRKCNYSDKEILSVYSPTSPLVIYENSIWWSDKWEPMDYGREFDFSRPFFEQFEELQRVVPRMNLQNWSNENSDYCNDSSNLKNCYLCFNADGMQDSYYINTGGYGKDLMDLFWCIQCELCYECAKVHESYHCFWCFNGKNLSDSYFCEDCRGCKNCFGCIGLRQKEYCIYNEQKTKEKYKEIIKNFKFTHPNIQEAKEKLADLRLKVPHQNLQIHNSENCTGDYIAGSKNCTECFDVMNSDNCKYVWDGIINNSMDCYNVGFSDFVYESLAIYKGNNIKFSSKCNKDSVDLNYCDYCSTCEYCFGCVALKHKKYCILNKQYSKEEYEKMKNKIIEKMEKDGEWGEFFPAKLSPFGYNDSMAQDYFPLSKEEALEQGFNWNDFKNPEPTGAKTIPARRLPDAIEDVPDDVLKWAIECEKDKKPYKLIPQELNYYRKHGLAVPHLCPDCRHYERKAKMNPRKLWKRNCDKCQAEIQSSYSPERDETVYCEQCYLSAIY